LLKPFLIIKQEKKVKKMKRIDLNDENETSIYTKEYIQTQGLLFTYYEIKKGVIKIEEIEVIAENIVIKFDDVKRIVENVLNGELEKYLK